MGRPSELIVGGEGDADAGTSKLMQKMRDQPFMPIGIAGALGVLGYQVYNFRFKSEKVPLSLFLIRTRVFAQGMVVTAMTFGVGYNVAKHFYKKWTGKMDQTVAAAPSVSK